MVEFGEWLCEEVLKYVPHRQWVFSIPKRLRTYFMIGDDEDWAIFDTSKWEYTAEVTGSCGVTPVRAWKYVFVTAGRYTGVLDPDGVGITAIDQICQAEADAAALAGDYLAGISTRNPDEDPESRFEHTSLDYVLPNP